MQLECRQPRGDGLRHCADLPAGDARLDELHAVGQRDRDVAAELGANALQAASHQVRTSIELDPGARHTRTGDGELVTAARRKLADAHAEGDWLLIRGSHASNLRGQRTATVIAVSSGDLVGAEQRARPRVDTFATGTHEKRSQGPLDGEANLLRNAP